MTENIKVELKHEKKYAIIWMSDAKENNMLTVTFMRELELVFNTLERDSFVEGIIISS